MSSYQIFSLAVAVICALYGLKIWLTARIDKQDPMYGQSVATAIWAFLLAFCALLRAFGDSWA